MPAERLIDPREHASDKVSALSDLEYRVWMTYKIAADDFGVMRAAVSVLQAAHRGLERLPAPKVKAALTRLISTELLRSFKDGSETYVCSLVWQNHQRVRYPRTSPNPTPPQELLAQCSAATAELFRKHSRKSSEVFRESSRNPSELFQENPEPPTRGGARNANANANANAEASGWGGAEGSPETAPAPGHPRPRPATLIDGRQALRHGSHGFCGRDLLLCLPGFLLDEFMGASGQPTSDDRRRYVLGWCATVDAAWSGKPVGDMTRFWRERWRESHATPKAEADTPEAPGSKFLRAFGALPGGAS